MVVGQIAKDMLLQALPDFLAITPDSVEVWGQSIGLDIEACGDVCADIVQACPNCEQVVVNFINEQFSDFAGVIADYISLQGAAGVAGLLPPNDPNGTLIDLGSSTLIAHNPLTSAFQFTQACQDGDSNVLTALSSPANTSIVFAPNGNLGTWSASGDPGGTVANVALPVSTPAPVVALSSVPGSALGFGGVPVNSSTSSNVTIQNTGNVAFNITSIQITGTNSVVFQQSPGIATPKSVGPNSSVQIPIVFTPTAAISYLASVCIGNTSSNAGPSKCLTLSGNGVSTGTPPSAPQLVSPGTASAPGQMVSTTTPTFTWVASSNATYYNIYISVAPYGSGNLVYTSVNISSGTTSFQIPSGVLQTGFDYRWNMSATNSVGTTYATPAIYFQVTSGSSSPTVSGISPPVPTLSPTAQTLTIAGSGFTSGATVTFTKPNSSSVSVTQFLSVSATSITLQATLNLAGGWTVSVTTPGSQVSNSYPFQVAPASAANDFSLQLSPAAVSVNAGASVALTVLTGTTSGAAQTMTLSANNAPTGITSSLSPVTIISGNTSTLTLSASSTVTPGNYTIAVSGAGNSNVSHAAQVALTVTTTSSGTPAVTLTPSTLAFSDQAVGTNSPTQLVTLRNTGTSQLTISALSLAAGSDYGITGAGAFPLSLPASTSTTFQVYFSPTITGRRTGTVYVWDNAPGSPQALSLTGNGLPAQPTTGTIQVNINLNGQSLPQGNWANYTLSGPSPQSGDIP
jgi:hypothetical protein